MAFDYCNTGLPDHELIACGNWKKSGFDAIAFVETDYTITDWTSTAEWQADITAGNIKLVQQAKGELPAAALLEGTNPVGGGVENITDGFDWTFNLEDANVTAGNDGYWEQMNKRQVYVVLHINRENEILVVLQLATVTAVLEVGGGSGKDYQKYTVTIKWESNVDEFPDRYTAPAGIFS